MHYTNLAGDLALVKKAHATTSRKKSILVAGIGCRKWDSVKLNPPYKVKCAKNDSRPLLINVIEEKLSPERSHTTGWLFAVLTGQRQFLSHKIKKVMRELGISHMCAVSGFHLTFILVIVRVIESLAGRISATVNIGSKLSTLLPVFRMIIIYIWLDTIGYKSSAVRASLCYCLSPISRLSGRRSNLAFLFSCFLILSPLDLYNFSSLLSWFSYALIIGSYSGQKKYLGSIGLKIISIFNLQTLLLVMSYVVVGETSTLGFIGNLIVLPILVLVIYAGIVLSLVLSKENFLWVCDWLDYLWNFIETVSSQIFLYKDFIFFFDEAQRLFQIFSVSVVLYFILRSFGFFEYNCSR